MSSQEFRVERLMDGLDGATFSCGVEALDRYLREHAGQDQRRRLSATYVLVAVATGAVAGFDSLAASAVEPSSLPASITKRLPRRPLPVTLIGRLAVDLEDRGRALGRRLLVDALLRAEAASRGIGAMAAIVDAKDDSARAFSERHGFRRFADDPPRLFMPMVDMERLLQGN